MPRGLADALTAIGLLRIVGVAAMAAGVAVVWLVRG